MISKYQLFCILLLSRLSSEIVFPQTGGFSGTSFAALLTAEGARLLLALPLLIYSSRGRDLYGAVAAKSRIAGIFMAFLAAFSALFLAVRTALYTAEYAQRTIITGMSAAVIAVFIAAFAVYMAVKGAEALSRAGVLFLVAAAIITLTVVLSDIRYMQMRVIGGADLSESFWYHVLEQMLRGGEYLIFAALLPFVRDGGSGTLLMFSLCSVAGVVLIGVFSMSVLGEFYGIAEYPFTAAAELSDITLFKRLDGLAAAIWTLCAAFRSGLLACAAYNSVNAVLNIGQTEERGKA